MRSDLVPELITGARFDPTAAHTVAAEGVTGETAPPEFPASIPLYLQPYRNWVGSIHVDHVWTCAPRAAADVVTLANWARVHGYRLRARGHMHNFSPLTLTGQPSDAQRVVLVDTTQHLTGRAIASTRPATVWVGAGTSMESLLSYLERRGYGLTAAPATGNLTVGGVLAIGAHGTGVATAAEYQPSDHLWGSLSNLVVALTAVVWDQASDRYVARTFHRSHPDCAALLTHLGRAFITDVTLRVRADSYLQCVSALTTPASRLFAAPGATSTQSFAAMVERSGRVEAIWFPFTDRTWIKTWSVQPSCPSRSRPVDTPYNYPFSDNIPRPLADLASKLIEGAPQLAPALGALQYRTTAHGLASTMSTDIWGPSKNLLLYSKPTTLRYSLNGYAILTRRCSIQRVVHQFSTFYQERLHAYQQQGKYPVNGPIEIRVSGLDHPRDIDVTGAQEPTLSAVAPNPNNPEWDVAVWLDLLTFPNTPYAAHFYREIEEFVFTNYRAPYAMARAEWSKGWAYTDDGAWSDPTILTKTIPGTFGTAWSWAISRLSIFDPHRIFSNEFLDHFFH
jgi:FAD/FMN-containing dehydrogenase